MNKMKALVYHGPGRLSVETRERPEPAAGMVRLKVYYVAICGSDLGAYKKLSDRFSLLWCLDTSFPLWWMPWERAWRI